MKQETKNHRIENKAKLKAKAPSPPPTQPAELIKVGVDIGLEKYAVCRQIDNSLAEASQMMSPVKFKIWLQKQKSLGRRVVVCYEAGLFGFELARWIQTEKMECVVMAPIKLDEANRRVETDKLNARDICSRLDRYLAGNTRALTSCRIPTREEELARQQTRQRQQLLDTRKTLQVQGRCLLYQFGYLAPAGGYWWDEVLWGHLSKNLSNDPKILEGLTRWRTIILEIDQQLSELEKQLAEQAKTDLPPSFRQNVPLGMGWLSLLILCREIMDWERIRNRRQAAGFTGLVPSESSTGQSVRQGSITKVGNPRTRTILVEMAWRMVRFQPSYHGLKRWQSILCDKKSGARARKRAIVAVARVLGVDLWRLATNQTTSEKLGFTVKVQNN